MQTTDRSDGLGEKIDPRILFPWAGMLALLLIGKALIAPHCIPRYTDVMVWNTALAAVTAAGAFGIFRMNPRPGWAAESAIVLLVAGYGLYEADAMLPFVYQESPSAGLLSPISLFFLILIVKFSLILSYLSFSRHVVSALLFLLLEGLYIHLLMTKLQNESEMLMPFLLLQAVFLFILFRSLKIITVQQRRTQKLLEEQRRLNEQLAASGKKLMEQEKLVSIGKMSAGLSHQINNPLTYLQGNLVLLREQVEGIEKRVDEGDKAESPPLRDFVVEMKPLLEDYRRGFEQIASVVERLRYFGRRSSSKPEWCDLRDIVKMCVEIQSSTVDHRISFSVDEGDPVRIFGSPSDFVNISSNILENAAEAIEQAHNRNGGKGKHPKKDPAGESTGRVSAAMGGAAGAESPIGNIEVGIETSEEYVFLTFTDNGPGIRPDIIERVSGPFFSTGESGVKLGLGLAMCKNILLDYDGELQIESSEGKGTTVTAKIGRRRRDAEN